MMRTPCIARTLYAHMMRTGGLWEEKNTPYGLVFNQKNTPYGPHLGYLFST